MNKHVGATIAAGTLCAIAATVGLWSGPLAAASGALHTGTDQTGHVTVRTTSSSASGSTGSAGGNQR